MALRPKIRATIYALGAVLIAWIAGLVWFAATLPNAQAVKNLDRIDGIVVFTGSAGRIKAAVQVLEAGVGERLLVSGVNRTLSPEVIRAAIGRETSLVDCCIDLGRQALNTRGNAKEAADWARQHGYESVLIITADWHMRRSMLELSPYENGLAFRAMAVNGNAGLGSLALEYSKYLAALIRLMVSPEAPV